MKLYRLIDINDNRELGWAEIPDDGGPPVFSDDATRKALEEAAGGVPLEETESFIAAAQADLVKSNLVRLVEAEG